MPRGIYDRSKSKARKVKAITKQVKQVNPVQEIVDEVNYLRAKAKSKQTLQDLADKQELENLRTYVGDTRRVLADRVNTIVALLEMLKSAL